MIKTHHLIAIGFFFVSIRALTTTLLSTSNTSISEYAGLTSQILTFSLLLAICAALIRQKGEKFPEPEETRSSVFVIWNAFAIAVVLFGFTLGQHAVEVLVISNLDIGLAHQLWSFPQVPPDRPDHLSPGLAFSFLSAILLAPAAEEIFFRKLLLESLCRAYSARTAVLISSLVFTAMHFRYVHYVSCFVFAITLALLYLKSRSILICIVIHGIFNMFALLSELYGVPQMLAEQNIQHPSSWFSYLIMYAFSVTALVMLAIKFKRLDTIDANKTPAH